MGALVRAGDRDGYRRHCLAMIERFGESDQWQERERTLKICSLGPDGIEIPGQLLASVSKQLDDGSASLTSWGNATRALAAYRQGRWADAAQWADMAALDQHAISRNRAKALLVCALAKHRQGDAAAAKQKLTQALEIRDLETLPRLADGSIDERVLLLESTAWFDWINVELLRREAALLIGDSQAAVPDVRPLLMEVI